MLLLLFHLTQQDSQQTFREIKKSFSVKYTYESMQCWVLPENKLYEWCYECWWICICRYMKCICLILLYVGRSVKENAKPKFLLVPYTQVTLIIIKGVTWRRKKRKIAKKRRKLYRVHYFVVSSFHEEG